MNKIGFEMPSHLQHFSLLAHMDYQIKDKTKYQYNNSDSLNCP
jgi:hypothetical protein